MTDLQKAAKAFVERWVPADSRTGLADFMKQRVCRHDFLSGAAYREAEIKKLEKENKALKAKIKRLEKRTK